MFVIPHFSTLKMMIRTTLRNTNQQKMHFSIFMVINVISSIVSKKKNNSDRKLLPVYEASGSSR